MSVQSWLDEFLPEIPNPEVITWTKVISCSKKIWTGRKPENLEKHDIIHEPIASCPLCVKDMHMQSIGKEAGKPPRRDCGYCPIKLSTGNTCRNAYWNPNQQERVEQILDLLGKAQEYVTTHPECEEA